MAACHDIAIGDRLASAYDGAVACRTHAAIHAEKFRALFDQSDTTCGAGLAERHESLPHRPAAAGDHLAPLRIGIDVNDCHLVPVGLQLVGDNAGERSTDMMAHFCPDDVDGYSAVAVKRISDSRLEPIAEGSQAELVE